MQIEILHENKPVGTAEIETDGLYWTIDAKCSFFGNDVYRLWAHDECASVRLGVLVPSGAELCLSKRLPIANVSFSPSTIISTRDSSCGSVGGYTINSAQILEADGKRTVCFEYRDEPFLPMEYICFFRLEERDGKLFWMAEVDERNFPVFC